MKKMFLCLSIASCAFQLQAAGSAGLSEQELGAFFREERVPPTQEQQKLGSSLYKTLNLPGDRYNQKEAYKQFEAFKKSGGKLVIKSNVIARKRLFELHREYLRNTR